MSQKKVIAVIPARMGASRFPGKPLAQILDLPMIEHVRRRVILSDVVDDVVVATCDQEIVDAVQAHGGKAVMTANTHERCTDRVEEATQDIDADIVIIVQGDEPLFMPEVAKQLVEPMLQDEGIVCTNLLSTIKKEEDIQNTDIVKALLDQKSNVLYFSRASVPYRRVKGEDVPLYRQTGLSAFTKKFLVEFSRLAPTPLEITESVDFFRTLEHGFAIRGVIYDKELYGVDNPGDVDIVEKILEREHEQKNIYNQILKRGGG